MTLEDIVKDPSKLQIWQYNDIEEDSGWFFTEGYNTLEECLKDWESINTFCMTSEKEWIRAEFKPIDLEDAYDDEFILRDCSNELVYDNKTLNEYWNLVEEAMDILALKY